VPGLLEHLAQDFDAGVLVVCKENAESTFHASNPQGTLRLDWDLWRCRLQPEFNPQAASAIVVAVDAHYAAHRFD
jgi:hypothetical protein